MALLIVQTQGDEASPDLPPLLNIAIYLCLAMTLRISSSLSINLVGKPSHVQFNPPLVNHLLGSLAGIFPGDFASHIQGKMFQRKPN